MANIGVDNNHGDFHHPFIDASWDGEGAGITAKAIPELRMIRLSFALRSKPSWWTKYKDETIREKWKEEALQQEILGGKCTEAEVDYVLDELKGYEALYGAQTGIQVSCTDGTWQSDSLITADLRAALMKDIAVLENIPEEKKDWHPGSNGQVLDIVHPSLYCLVYKRTLAFPPGDSQKRPDQLKPIPGPAGNYPEAKFALSQKFAWIPTDFSVSADGKKVSALGYINNLHPSNASLYRNLENTLAAFVPLFERVLTDVHAGNDTLEATRCHGGYEYPTEDDGGEDDEDEDRYEARQQARPIILPTVPEAGYEGGLEDRETHVNLKGRNIQVIVKLANIELTPEKPEYEGGKWHVEGMLNEHIAASGIYYYAEENIAESSLAFRTAVIWPDSYEQDDSWGVARTYGFGRDEPANQELGSVPTKQGRCIAFPNLFQHRVSPFKLTDPSKPGHRKILVFFLVDPSISPIPSTSIIPPQQKEWAAGELWKLAPDAGLNKLPVELIEIIGKEVDLMSREEAEKYRLELMEERTVFVADHDAKFFSIEFNMCEH